MFAILFSYLLLTVTVLSANSCFPTLPNILSIFRSPSLGRGTLPPGYQITKNLIIANGFEYKENKVETEDGYILRVHRIIGKKPGGHPVLFSHYATGSSEAFLVNGRESSLAFQLADAGFDVWLYDRRGNWYSREHVKYKPNTREFWDFSFDESGYYDLPAVINYVIKVTNYSRISVVGHSMGTTDICVMASMRPEYNDKVKLAILLAPALYTPALQEVNLPFLRYMMTVSDDLYQFGKRSSIYEFISKQTNTIEVMDKCCEPSTLQAVCKGALQSLIGDFGNTINKTEFPNVMIHLISGTSSKTMHHLSQLFKFGVAHYSYGAKENLIRYQNVTPPSYRLDKVTLPIAIYWSTNDPFINERTAKLLEDQFPNVVEIYKIEEPNFNHLSYIIGSNTNLVNNRVFKLFNRL